MDRKTFDEYVRRFNAEDSTAFDEFLSSDVTVQNGGLRYQGVDGMKSHYASIWGRFKEVLHVQRFVSDGESAAVHLVTTFDVLVDAADTPFGSVRAGERFEYDGIVFYEMNSQGQFSDIKVSYLSFTRVDLNGARHSLGLAH